jgi:hypothetical protein
MCEEGKEEGENDANDDDVMRGYVIKRRICKIREKGTKKGDSFGSSVSKRDG